MFQPNVITIRAVILQSLFTCCQSRSVTRFSLELLLLNLVIVIEAFRIIFYVVCGINGI